MGKLLRNRWVIMVVAAVVTAAFLTWITQGGAWAPWPSYRDQLTKNFPGTEAPVTGTVNLVKAPAHADSPEPAMCPVFVVPPKQPIPAGEYILGFRRGTDRSTVEKGKVAFDVKFPRHRFTLTTPGRTSLVGYPLQYGDIAAHPTWARYGKDCEGLQRPMFLITD